jgi:hypothetical protein
MTDTSTPSDGQPPQPPMTRRDLEARIIANAWRDPKYKEALLKDPRSVLQRELSMIDPSVVLPAGLQVQVHEEEPNSYHLVLPRNPKDITLNEVIGDNLEAVAPQTVAVVVVGAVALTIGAVVNAIGGGNVVAGGNVVTVGNAVGNFNTIA